MLTLVSSSSLLPVQITILSTNGTDLTPSVPILHSHIPLSTHQKRSYTSVAIQECSLIDTYKSRSWCQHEVSPQKVETLCTEIPEAGWTNPRQRTYINEGRCAGDEICVGSNAGDEDTPRQAYCVSTNDFLLIGHNSSSGNGQDLGSSAVITAGFNPTLYDKNATHLAVEAVITSVNNRTSLFAASAVIQAQSYNGLWRTVTNGYNSCMRCSSLTLAPFPITAQRVKVDVVMPDSSPTGLLWLASYAY